MDLFNVLELCSDAFLPNSALRSKCGGWITLKLKRYLDTMIYCGTQNADTDWVQTSPLTQTPCLLKPPLSKTRIQRSIMVLGKNFHRNNSEHYFLSIGNNICWSTGSHMNSSQEHTGHRKALEYITLIGCSLSLLGIVITLILHMVLWGLVVWDKLCIFLSLT